MFDKIAHEIWSASQLLPHEGIEDGVIRIKAILKENLEQLKDGICPNCKGVGIFNFGCMTEHSCSKCNGTGETLTMMPE